MTFCTRSLHHDTNLIFAAKSIMLIALGLSCLTQLARATNLTSAASFTVSTNGLGSQLTYDYSEFEFDSDDHKLMDTEWLIKFIPSIVFYSALFIVGIFGNILVIFAVCYLKRLQSITNMFLVSLATADLLLIIICVPIKIIEFFTTTWIFGPFMCKVFHYMQFFTAICSVLNLTTMSLERYMAILHPFKARHTYTKERAKLHIIATWIVSSLLAVPIVFGKGVVKVGLRQEGEACIRIWDPYSWKIFEIFRTILILILPFVIMLITYSRICIELWKMPSVRRDPIEIISLAYPESFGIPKSTSTKLTTINKSTTDAYQIDTKRKRQHEDSCCVFKSPDESSTIKKIVRMLIWIVVMFFISWTPLILNNLLISFSVLPNANTGIYWYLRLVFFAMSYVNSCINPIVYALMSKNFREAYKHLFAKFFSNQKKMLIKKMNENEAINSKNNRKRSDINKNDGANNANEVNSNDIPLLNDNQQEKLMKMNDQNTIDDSHNHIEAIRRL